MKVSIVFVNYNDWHYLDPCIDSIYKFKYPWPIEIIVTDNGSDNDEAKKIKEKYPDVIVIEAGENLGFAKGNNVAIEQAKGEYIFVLNGDTKFIDDNIAKAVDFLENNPGVGMLGPELLNEDGSHQGSTFLKNNLKSIFFSILRTSLYLDKLAFKKSKSFDIKQNQPVGFILGAAMLVRRQVIEKVGVFDERFFFSAEEQDWCYRTLKKGYKIVYFPEWKIMHFGGGARGGLWYLMQYHRATMLYFEKYWGFWGKISVKILFMVYGITRFTKMIPLKLLRTSDDFTRKEYEKYFKIILWHVGVIKTEHISRKR